MAWWKCSIHEPYQRPVVKATRFAGRCRQCSNTEAGRPDSGKSIADLHPDIALEWHPELNGEVTPEQVFAMSSIKRWWLCSEHGAYELAPSDRMGRLSRRCPLCPRRTSGTRPVRNTQPKARRSLADDHPGISSEWHPTKNGETTPEDVTSGSKHLAWWSCGTHGSYRATVCARTAKGTGCTPCGRERIGESRRRPKQGESLAELHPDVAADWDQNLNSGTAPLDVKGASNGHYWWACQTHGAYHMRVNDRTLRGMGCPTCATYSAARGHGVMTKKRLVILLESFRDGLGDFSLSQAQMLTLGVQAGVAKNTAFMQVVNGHSVKALDDTIRSLTGDDAGDDDAVDPAAIDKNEIIESIDLSVGVARIAPHKQEPAAAHPPGPATPADGTRSDQPSGHPFPPGIGEPQQLPVPKAGPVLRNAGALLAAADSEAAEYLVASSVEQLWKAAYQDPETSDVETSDVRENLFEERVRAAFRVEFDAARSVVPPAGWNFEPLGPGTGIKEPLLMQAHVATQLADRRRIGNWSGTGAGKTVSAILGARLIGAGFGGGVVLVVCPNNTLDGWKNSILNCYPDSRISTGGLDPVWESGTGPRWMVVNFDALSQPNSAELVEKLLAHGDVRLDMVAIDEIHLAKLRGQQGQHSTPNESKRRTNLKAILAGAAEQHIDLAVLGMSATPLINDLNEARSVLELISGHEYPDLDTFANTQNCLKMHQQFVLAGTRFMPDYEAELDEVTTEVDCDHLVEDIRTLGIKTNPSAVEKVLLAAKLPVIVDECRLAKSRGKKSFVYVHYVDGIIDPIRSELEAAGLTVGVFTGEDKDGLSRFTGKHGDGTPVADSERVDVLIGSSAISTGVDGLQHVTDTLVFAVLPWTAAEREQIVGRVHRTGQRSDRVRAVTPVTVAGSHLVQDASGQSPWSWCRRRLSVLTYKQSVADAVLEGVIAKSLTVSPQKATDAILTWIHRLENQGEYVAVRPANYEKAA